MDDPFFESCQDTFENDIDQDISLTNFSILEEEDEENETAEEESCNENEDKDCPMINSNKTHIDRNNTISANASLDTTKHSKMNP